MGDNDPNGPREVSSAARLGYPGWTGLQSPYLRGLQFSVSCDNLSASEPIRNWWPGQKRPVNSLENGHSKVAHENRFDAYNSLAQRPGCAWAWNCPCRIRV